MIQTFLGVALAISTAIALVSSLGAHFSADYLKRNGAVPKSTSDFARSAPPPFFLDVGISLTDIYSSLHKRYKSRFLTRCVYVARVAFPLSGFLLIVLGVAIGIS